MPLPRPLALLAVMLLAAAPGACSVDDGGPVGSVDAAHDAAPDAAHGDLGHTPDAAASDLGALSDAGPTPDLGVTTDPGSPDLAVAPDPGPPDPGATPDPGPPDAGACPITLLRLNEGAALGDGITSAGTVYAIRLTPSQAGIVQRVELYTAGVDAPVTATVGLHGDLGGSPAPPALATGTLSADTTPAWREAELDVTVELAPGADVWVVLTPDGDMALPQAASGDNVDFLWGFGFGEWITAAQQAPWMVRLVGCP